MWVMEVGCDMMTVLSRQCRRAVFFAHEDLVYHTYFIIVAVTQLEILSLPLPQHLTKRDKFCFCSHSDIETQNVVCCLLLTMKLWFTLNIWNVDFKSSYMTLLRYAWTLCKLQAILLSSVYIPVTSEGQKADSLYVAINGQFLLDT